MKALLTVFCFVILSHAAQSQLIAPLCIPDVSKDMPSWAQHLYSLPINIFRVDSAYDDYYRTHSFVKNNYTKYYKRLRRLSAPFIQSDGTLPSLQPAAVLRADNNHSSKHQSPQATIQWKALGPFETYTTSNGTSTPALWPWQTNIYSFDIAPSNPNILYAVSETGGFFKSIDKAKTWSQLEPGVYSSADAVAIHPTNPDVVFVGISGGLIKTTDGGKTWRSVWKLSNLWIYDLEVHASQPSIVYAATSQGFYVSKDAGATWSKTLDNSCCDLETNANNRNEVYTLRLNAAKTMYEFWKSTDAGQNFTIRSTGWLTSSGSAAGGRMTVTPADPNRIYACMLGDSTRPYIMRSDDAGEHWRISCRGNSDSMKMNDGQGYYDLSIAASHKNADLVIVGTQTAYRSSDGGNTFTTAIGGYSGTFPLHPDVQEMKVLGDDCLCATDGGMNYSTDLFGANWECRNIGVNGSDFWGFDCGWNEDVMVGGRYHNGNTAWVETYGTHYLRMGGGEAATGYINPIQNHRAYFSDIGGYVLPDSAHHAPQYFSVGKWPNESYYNMEYSEMRWDPRCYNDVWIGNSNVLMRSRNGAQSYDSVWSSSDNDAVLQHIEICRSNPDVMYVSQRSNKLGDGKIWKSVDGAKSFSALPIFPLTTGGERRVMRISASGKNENVLFAALLNGSSANKVFKTTDGGKSWINLTTPTIANVGITDIVYQYGTDDGVYLACYNGRVFYRNISMSDWVLYGEGLPYALFTRALKPFYRDSKIRTGSSMGIWEAPLYEHSRPEAQPSVDKRHTSCERDTFFFDDYSVLERANAQWSWSFPGASWVSDTHVRNPKVLYDKPGNYTVSLTVSNTYGTDTKVVSNMIEVYPSDCGIQGRADMALDMGARNDVVSIAPLYALSAHSGLTVTCWLKLDTIQQSFSQILSNWSSDVGFSLGFSFQGYRANTNLTFYWKNVPYQLTSPFNLPVDQWVHVAITIDDDHATLYMNGIPWIYKNAAADFKNFHLDSTPWEIGGGLPGQGGNYRGSIDELMIYRKALDSNTIRRMMHIIEPVWIVQDTVGDYIAPVAYFQFNEKDSTRFFNRFGAQHAANAGSKQVHSTAPVSTGYTYYSVGTDAELDVHAATVYRGDNTPGTVFMSVLDGAPDSLKAFGNRQTPYYWILHAYNTTGPMKYDSIKLKRVGALSRSDAQSPTFLGLQKRQPNEHYNTWWSCSAGISADSASQSLTFGPDTNIVGQYLISTSGSSPLDVHDDVDPQHQSLRILPNPTANSATVFACGTLPATLRIVNSRGEVVLEQIITTAVSEISTNELSSGVYTVQMRTNHNICSVRLVVVH